MNFFNRKPKEQDYKIIQREGRAPMIVPIKIHEIFESAKMNPTPEDAQLGMCETCGFQNKKMSIMDRFLSSLRDLGSPNSCFMKGHNVENYGKQMTQKEIDKWAEIVEEEGRFL